MRQGRRRPFAALLSKQEIVKGHVEADDVAAVDSRDSSGSVDYTPQRHSWHGG